MKYIMYAGYMIAAFSAILMVTIGALLIMNWIGVHDIDNVEKWKELFDVAGQSTLNGMVVAVWGKIHR